MEKLSYKTLFTIVTILLVAIVFLLRIRQKPTTVSAAWFNTSWTRRLALTIDHTKVGADQTDFPIYVNLANLPASFHTYVNQTDARDIRVTKADGTTELPREVVSYSASTDSGELYFKYTGTLSSTVDTQIFIYYGNPSASDYNSNSTYGKYNVWDSNFVGVWHLNEVGSTRFDSTSNGNHLAISGTVSFSTSGKIGTAGSFTSAGNLFRTDSNLTTNFPSKSGQTTTNFSVSYWLKPTTLGFLDWLGKESNDGWYFYDNTSVMNFAYFSPGEITTSTSAISTGAWSYLVGVHNDGTDTDTFYLNGSASGNNTGRTGNPNASSASFRLGGTDSFPNEADGLIDEVRISNTPRSATWVSTEHNNQNSPSTFFKSSMPTETSNIGPVAWWKFDENGGTTVHDSSVNRLDGVIETGGTSTALPSWTIGKYNSAIKFDGLGNRFTKSGDSALLRPSTSMSVEAWVYLHALPSEVAGNREVIIMKKHSGSPWESYELQADYTASENRFTFAWVNSAGTGYNAFTRPTTFTMSKGVWYHVVGVRNGASLKIYVNGVDLTGGSNLPSSGDTIYVSNSDTQIGSDGNTAAFKGAIDEVKVYDYALSIAQIKDAYNSASNANIGNNLNDTFTNGLVGYWKMDENTGTSMTDSSGIGNTAVFATGSSAPSWGFGKFGIGISLDGTTDYASVSDSDTLDLTNNFTLSAWVNPTDLTTGEKYILSKDGSGDTTDAYNFFLQAGGRVCYETNNRGGNVCSPSNLVFINNWYHVVAVFDNSGQNKVTFYVNGQKTGYFNSNTTQAPVALNTNLLIGRQGLSGSMFSGAIDEVRIYNRSLSESEVNKLYNYTAPPIGYWKMNETSWTNNCSTSTAIDSSGYNHDLRSCPASTGPTGGSLSKFDRSGIFDGSDDYLESTSTDFNLTDQITISAWVKPITAPSGDVYIVDKTNNNLGYSFGLHSPPEPRIRIGNSTSYTTITSSEDLVMGTWYYLSAVVSPDRTAKIYINGNFSVGATNITLFGSTQNFRIGGRSASTYLNAQIDEVKIYNYPLTQKQIVSDMNQGSPISTKTTLIHYKFNEGTGTTAFNSTRTTLNGVLGSTTASPTWTKSGKDNGALSFDGGDYIQVADSNDLDFTDDFTISAWVARSGGVNEYIVSKTDDSSDGGYALLIGNLGEVYCRTVNGSGHNDSYTATGFVLADSTWHHLAATRAGTSCRVYVDGIDRTNTAATHTTLTANAKTLRIGTQPAGGNYTVGKIDDVKVYNYALTSTEIKADYNASSSLQLGQVNQSVGATTNNFEYCIPGDTSSCSLPIAEWVFDSNVGTPSTIPDTSGNGNVGVVSGGMTSSNWVPGKTGSALRFDGVNDYVNVYSANFASQWNSSQGAITAWFKYDEGASTNGVQQHVLTIGADTNNSVEFRKASDNTFSTRYVAGATAETSADCSPNTNGYIFVAQSWDKANDKVYHYCNGLLTDIDTTLGTWAGALSSSRATVGAHTTSATFPLKGAVDNVRVYNYTRTPAQIAYDYNHGAPSVWYKLDECQGSTIRDSMGTGYSGAITVGSAGSQNTLGTCQVGTSAAWTNGASGKIGGSFSFDGNDDLIGIAEADTKGILDVGSSESFSVAFWLKPNSLPTTGNYATYVGKNNGANGWYAQVYSDGSPEFCIVNSTVHCYQGGPGYITTGSWQHYAFSITSGTDSTAKLYYNGKLISGVWSGTNNLTFPSGNTNLTFGSNGDSTEEANGLLDDVRIYNYPLTSTQVNTIINNGAVKF